MIFLNSASSPAALVLYLPGVYTQTDTEGKLRQKSSSNSSVRKFPASNGDDHRLAGFRSVGFALQANKWAVSC